MTLGTCAASSKGTRITPTLSMELAARFHCRADPPTPRWRHITLRDRSCLCWIDLRQLRNSTAQGSPVPSDSRDFHTHRPPTRMKLTKKGHCCAPRISLVSLVIL